MEKSIRKPYTQVARELSMLQVAHDKQCIIIDAMRKVIDSQRIALHTMASVIQADIDMRAL